MVAFSSLEDILSALFLIKFNLKPLIILEEKDTETIESIKNYDCKLIFHNNACLKLNNNNGLISDFCRLGNKQAFCLHPVENRNDNYQIKPYNNQDLCLSMNIISPELTSCNNQENTLWNADPL